jgi:hypothetical protein
MCVLGIENSRPIFVFTYLFIDVTSSDMFSQSERMKLSQNIKFLFGTMLYKV